MSDKTFKASNGIVVTISDEGYLTGTGGNENSVIHATGGAEYGVQALREFFRNERDTELGRTRWPENPDYVICRDESEDDKDGRFVRVVNESKGISIAFWEKLTFRSSQNYDRAARWYFTEGPGKPERPWEEARAGEVWRLTVAGEDDTFLVKEAFDGTPFFFGQESSFDAGTSCITAGRKLLEADGTPTEGPKA